MVEAREQCQYDDQQQQCKKGSLICNLQKDRLILEPGVSMAAVTKHVGFIMMEQLILNNEFGLPSTPRTNSMDVFG